MKNKLVRIVLVVTGLLVFGLTASCQSQDANTPATPIILTAAPTGIPEAATTITPTIEPTPDAVKAQSAIIQALLALNTQSNRMESTTLPAGGQAQSHAFHFQTAR